jgi:hypothetical protein
LASTCIVCGADVEYSSLEGIADAYVADRQACPAQIAGYSVVDYALEKAKSDGDSL